MSAVDTDKKDTSHKLLKSSAVVGVMTMLSRVLGLIRDNVFFRYIGADSGADAFFLAFKIPNFLRRLFAEGAFAQAFVPVLSEYKEQGSKAAVKELIDRVAGCLGSSLLLVTFLMVIGAPAVTFIFAFGYWDNPEQFALTSDFIRWTAPYLFLISMTGFAGAILNSHGYFSVPAFTPVLLNVVLILAAVIVSPLIDPPALALAWGVLCAGFVQFVFQIPYLKKLQLMPSPKMDWHHPGVKKILTLMVPALFGVSVSQINLTIDTVLATLLPTGSVSWLYFSDRLSELPLGVFGIAIATVILPSLSRHSSAEDPKQFALTLDWAVRMIFVLGVPAAVALFILAEPILLTLFQYGKATVHDIQMSSYSLKAYSIGLLAFMLIKILASGFFSRQDMKTPVKIGVIAMVVNMVLNAVFVWFFMQKEVGHVGLALATSVSASLNAFLLFMTLRRQQVYEYGTGWLRFVISLAVSTTLMVVVLQILLGFWSDWAIWGWFERSCYLAFICIAGLVVYVSGLLMSGMRLRHFRAPH
ncbi:MAG: murein biosynthesis integral membrane protein MurJ [Cellvibrionaceae bacterium]